MASQGDSAKGLFASLFDFNFTSFITLKFLKVIYVIVMVLIFLFGIIFFFSGLLSGKATGVLAALFLVPIMVLLQLIILRVYLEALALFFRIGENTQAIRQSLGGAPGSSTPGGFGAYPTPPPTPQPGAGNWQQPPANDGWQTPPQSPPQPPPTQPGFPPPGA